jgi:hypothetical protein
MPVGQSEQKTYLTIAYGKLREKCKEGEPNAVWREFESKGSWAKEYQWIEGQISKIYYKESKDYGNSYEVTIDDGEKKWNVSFKENSHYCQDFLVKLPNIDLSKFVRINPYELKDSETGKDKRGTSVQQNGEKLKNFFSQKEGEVWVYRNGFPEPKKAKLSDKEWKIYLIEIQCFLMDYVKANIIPKLNDPSVRLGIDEEKVESANDSSMGSDLPF